MTITDIKSSADTGKFKAVLKNKAGQVESQEGVLTVTGKLDFQNAKWQSKVHSIDMVYMIRFQLDRPY